MLKKISAIIFICFALCFSTLVMASEMSLDAEVSFDSVNIVIDCGGAAMYNKLITVMIFEPEGGFGDLSGDGGETYTVTDAQTVNKTVSMIFQQKADVEGKIRISYKPKGLKGKYFIRVGGEGIYENQMLSFDFVSDNEAQSIVDNLVANPGTDRVAALFVKNSNPNVYTAYQILGLHNSAFYSDFDTKTDQTVKNAVYAYVNNKLKSGMTVEEFKTVFDKAVYVELVNGLSDNNLLTFVDTYKVYAGLDLIKEYTDIKNSETYYTDAVKAIFASRLEQESLSGADTVTVRDTIAELMLCSALSGCDSHGVMDELIKKFDPTISAEGGKVSDYTYSETPLNIARAVLKKKPFLSTKDFADKLNKSIKEVNNTGGQGISSTSRPSGGLSGKGGASNVYVTPLQSSTPVYTENSVSRVPSADSTVTKSFTDLAGFEWAKDAIYELEKEGIVNGKGEAKFAPQDVVTREEFAKMLVLTLGIKINNNADAGFADVSRSDWFSPYVNTAAENGIINGYNGRFGTGEPISREDMAVMCYRAMNACGIALTEERENHAFTDKISDYATEAVSALYNGRLINGRSDTEFAPKENTLRAEAAKFLYDILTKYNETIKG